MHVLTSGLHKMSGSPIPNIITFNLIIQRPYSSHCFIQPFLIIYYFQTAWYTNIVFQDVYNR